MPENAFRIDDESSAQCRAILKKDIESAGHLMASVCDYWIIYICQTRIRLEPRFVCVETICADTNNHCVFTLKVLLYRAKRCNFCRTNKCNIPIFFGPWAPLIQASASNSGAGLPIRTAIGSSSQLEFRYDFSISVS